MTETNTLFEPLLTSREAASLLQINIATLQRMARSGLLPAIKIGKLWRFRKSQLDEWLRSTVSFFRHPCRE
jgi:excisionase family DNA binding protein